MSVEASKWAWEQAELGMAEKLVLLCLADHADERGENCFPSQGRIAQKTGMGRRTVIKAVRGLREHGLIRTYPISQLEPFRQVLMYRLAISGPVKQLEMGVQDMHPPVHRMHTPCAPNAHPPVQQMHTEPSIRTVKEPSNTESEVSDSVPASVARHRTSPPKIPEWPLEHRDLLEFLQTQQFLQVPMDRFGLLDWEWWSFTMEACGGISVEMLKREFPKLAAWLKEKRKRLTKRGARRRIRHWLEIAAEQEERRGSATGNSGGQRAAAQTTRKISNDPNKYAGDIERGKLWDRLHGLDQGD